MTLPTGAGLIPDGFSLRHRDGDATKLHPVPAHLRQFLAPAEWVIYEWTPYVVEWDKAERLQIGSLWQQPIASGIFQFSFENQLGLTTIRAHDEHGPLGDPIYVEVIAGKFVGPEQSVDFLRQTLADLFARVTASPFVLGAMTERMVRESQAMPNALFAFHFFRHHGQKLIRALQAVLGRPHQRLTANLDLVRPHEVRRVDQESIVSMLKAGHLSPTAPTEHLDRLTPLQRLSPERVWQQIPIETFDTPENRFILAACRQMLSAVHSLRSAAWYGGPNVDPATRCQIDQVAEHLAMLTLDDRFASLGPMVVTPAHSRVLQRRDGYHEFAVLWQLFQRSRQPIFEQMQNAIDLRNIAELYEFWVWFELIDRIRVITGVEPSHVPVTGEFGVPGRRSSARFGELGTLHYNKSFRGYSGISLTPDFVWECPNGALIVMDAKFRMHKPGELIYEAETESSSFGDQRAKDDDLQKMHTYRDAIGGVMASVVVYPGNVAMFRSPDHTFLDVDLASLLDGNVEGIGAIPMSPITAVQGEE